MTEWRTYAPDGRELIVRRLDGSWLVRSGTDRANSRSLDVALIEVLRAGREFELHAHKFDYPGWVRAHAAMIEEQAGGANG